MHKVFWQNIIWKGRTTFLPFIFFLLLITQSHKRSLLQLYIRERPNKSVATKEKQKLHSRSRTRRKSQTNWGNTTCSYGVAVVCLRNGLCPYKITSRLFHCVHLMCSGPRKHTKSSCRCAKAVCLWLRPSRKLRHHCWFSGPYEHKANNIKQLVLLTSIWCCCKEWRCRGPQARTHHCSMYTEAHVHSANNATRPNRRNADGKLRQKERFARRFGAFGTSFEGTLQMEHKSKRGLLDIQPESDKNYVGKR